MRSAKPEVTIAIVTVAKTSWNTMNSNQVSRCWTDRVPYPRCSGQDIQIPINPPISGPNASETPITHWILTSANATNDRVIIEMKFFLLHESAIEESNARRHDHDKRRCGENPCCCSCVYCHFLFTCKPLNCVWRIFPNIFVNWILPDTIRWRGDPVVTITSSRNFAGWKLFS